jgi:hypothetical protein
VLKKTITYVNFDEEEVTKDYYFNISKAELAKVELEYGGANGIQTAFKNLLAAKDAEAIIAMFERFILMSYGERSNDGERFVKTPELTEAFRHTAAYSELFYELATSAEAGADFITGIMPKDVRDKLPKDIATTAMSQAVELPTSEVPKVLFGETETDNRTHPNPSAQTVIKLPGQDELLSVTREELQAMTADEFRGLMMKYEGKNVPKILLQEALRRF